MGNFTGAALYTEDEIRKALHSYEKEVEWADNLLKSKVTYAESRFKPSLWDKIVGNTTLEKKTANMFMTKEEQLYRFGWMELTKEEYKRLDDLNRYDKFNYLGVWLYQQEYLEIKNLFNGGKDCYLNPSQAAFVNKYKNLEV